MSKILNLFKNLDQLLFEKIDRLKIHPSYQKFLDKIAALDEKKQKLVKNSIVISTTLLPVILLVFVLAGNCSMRGSLSTQKEIYDLLNQIKAKKGKISAVGQQFFATHLINNKQELLGVIKNLVNSKQIEMNKIAIASFTSKKNSKTISEIEAAISFKDFSITELTDFMTLLMHREKVKITKLNIKKGKNDSLEGVIEIIHHGKSA